MKLLLFALQLVSLISYALGHAAEPPTLVEQAGPGCSFVPKVPYPKSRKCGVYGTLNHPVPLGQPITVASAEACREHCYRLSACLSFGFSSSTTSCQLYSKGIVAQGYHKSSSGPTVYFNRLCFHKKCPVKSSTTSTQASSSIKVTSKAPGKRTTITETLTSTVVSTVTASNTNRKSTITITDLATTTITQTGTITSTTTLAVSTILKTVRKKTETITLPEETITSTTTAVAITTFTAAPTTITTTSTAPTATVTTTAAPTTITVTTTAPASTITTTAQALSLTTEYLNPSSSGYTSTISGTVIVGQPSTFITVTASTGTVGFTSTYPGPSGTGTVTVQVPCATLGVNYQFFQNPFTRSALDVPYSSFDPSFFGSGSSVSLGSGVLGPNSPPQFQVATQSTATSIYGEYFPQGIAGTAIVLEFYIYSSTTQTLLWQNTASGTIDIGYFYAGLTAMNGYTNTTFTKYGLGGNQGTAGTEIVSYPFTVRGGSYTPARLVWGAASPSSPGYLDLGLNGTVQYFSAVCPNDALPFPPGSGPG